MGNIARRSRAGRWVHGGTAGCQRDIISLGLGGRKRPEATAMDRNSIGQGLLGRRASKYLKVLSKDD